MYRNPKDVMVSFFHYNNSMKGIEKSSDLEPFMQKFLSGKGKMFVTKDWFPMASLGVIDNKSTRFGAIEQR